MIAVIVGQENPFDRIYINAIVQQFVADKIIVDTGIDKHTAGIGADIGAITAAAASERDEFERTGSHKAVGLKIVYLVVNGPDRPVEMRAYDISGYVIAGYVDKVKQAGQFVKLT